MVERVKTADASPGLEEGAQERLQDLSRKLLDLWQDHLSAVAQDPALLGQALKLMTAAPFFPWMPGFPPGGGAAGGGAGFAQPASPFPFAWPSQPGAPAAPGTPSAAAAPGAGPGDVEQLRARLAELEGRLAKLEGRRPAEPAPARPRKSRRGAGKV